MSSSVFWRFKSQKEPQRVTFDGTGISVFELKRDIIALSRLGDGTDFDFAIYNPDTNEEYGDDTTIISRGTTVIARRLPAAKPGAGRAARYVSGKMPVTAKNQHRIEASRSQAPVKSTSTTNGSTEVNNAMTEEEKIAAMFQAGGEQWEQQQQMMAGQKAIHRPGGFQQKNAPVPDKPLPAGYTCHRCGEKGHWIQACPTNNDPNFDGRPKFRRTTGIPRSFLKVVDKPTALTSDGAVDVSQLPAGVMYTSTGEWVVAEPDKASWEQFQAKAQASAAKAEAAATGDQELRDRGLECPIDKRMFVDPMKTPCCGATYCRDCIENALLGNDFVCPNCSSDNVLVDNLTPDDETVEKIKAYEADKAKSKKEKEKSTTPDPEKKATGPAAEEIKKSSSQSPKPAAADTNSTTTQPAAATDSKKRAADEPLENPRIPTGPAAMRKQNAAAVLPVPAGFDQNFVQQMNALASSLPGNQSGMNAFAPHNMGFPNMMGMPPMMGMPMNMNMPMGMNMMGMGMGMGGMPMGMPMPNQMMMNGNNNWNGQQQMFNPLMGGGYNNNNNKQWQNGGAQGWNNNMQQQHQQQMGQNGGAGTENGAYMRNPVNPQRHQAKGKRQRSVDYREM